MNAPEPPFLAPAASAFAARNCPESPAFGGAGAAAAAATGEPGATGAAPAGTAAAASARRRRLATPAGGSPVVEISCLKPKCMWS